MLINPGDRSPPHQPGDWQDQGLAPDTHAFVVKIWLEAAPTPRRPPIWRGHVTHVRSGQRRSVKSLCEIMTFLAIHLQKLGVKPGIVDYVCRWFNR